MPTFKNLNALEKHLQSVIKDALMDDVAETAKDALDTAIDRVVYQVYVPTTYDRRYDGGGLSDRRLMFADPIKDGIIVETIAQLNPQYGGGSGRSDKVIVSGEGYMYGGTGKAFEKPRDFYAEARKIMKNEKLVKKAVKEGLEKRGLKVD